MGALEKSPAAGADKGVFRKYATFYPDAGDFGMNEDQWVKYVRENNDGGDGGLFYGDLHIVFNKLQSKGCMTFAQFQRAFQMLNVRHTKMTDKLGKGNEDSMDVDMSGVNHPVLLRETLPPPDCPFDVVQTVLKKVQTLYVTGNFSAAYSALEDARTLWRSEMEAAAEAAETEAEAARIAAEAAAAEAAAAAEKESKRGRRGARPSSPPNKGARDAAAAAAAAASSSSTGPGAGEGAGAGGGAGGDGSESPSKGKKELQLPTVPAVYFDLALAAVMLSDRQPEAANNFCMMADATAELGGLARSHPYFSALRLVEAVGLFQRGSYQRAHDLFREVRDMAGGVNAADSGAAANNMAVCMIMLGNHSAAMELYLEARKLLLLRGTSVNAQESIAIVMKSIADLHKARSTKTKRGGGQQPEGAAGGGGGSKGALDRFLSLVVPPAPPPRPPTPPPAAEEKKAAPAKKSGKDGKKDDKPKKAKKAKKKKIGPLIPPFYGATALAMAPAKKGKKGKKKK